MKNKIIIIIVIILFSITLTPIGVKLMNYWSFSLQKAEDVSSYKTLREVENTCRSMIASYEADKLVYVQYKESNDTEKQTWAEEAKMRANRTATLYNNYILENTFIWKNGVPKDISFNLEILK